MKDQELVQWYRQMAVLLNCGVSAIRALDVCRQQTSHKGIQNATDIVLQELRVGQRLSQAMEIAGAPFEALHWGAVEVGERQGDLALVFERLAKHSEETSRVKRRIISALAYPALVISVSLLGLYMILRFLAPVLAEVGVQLGEKLNILSHIMLKVGELCESELICLALVIIGLLSFRACARYLWKNRRKGVETFFFRLPLLGKMFRFSVLIRICQTLETMIGGGLSLTESIHLASNNCGSDYYATEVLTPTLERIKLGEGLCNSLRGAPGLPSSFYGLVLAGEESGELESSFRYLSCLYEMELVTAVETFLAALEPIAIVTVGVVVLGVLLSVFAPLSKLISVV